MQREMTAECGGTMSMANAVENGELKFTAAYA
jgi:hypothetical protein